MMEIQPISFYVNVWKEMGLNTNHFIQNDDAIDIFNGIGAKPTHRVFLNVNLAGKVVHMDFVLIDLEAPQNGLLGRSWTH